jgi:hypothetical protein
MAISEEQQVEQILRHVDFPDEVVDWDVELGSDWTDDPAAFVTVVIDDEVWTKEWLRAKGDQLRSLVKGAIRNGGIARWPYVTLMTKADRELVRSSEPQA